MSLSASFPREEILMSSPSSSTMATEKKAFLSSSPDSDKTEKTSNLS